jgi:putative hydrolase of the HAD superfamily
MPLPDGCAVVFDLDDTLYPERDFVQSGFRAVAKMIEHECSVDVFPRLQSLFDDAASDPFAAVISEHQLPISKTRLIDTYRTHAPQLTLRPEIRALLASLTTQGHAIGILTDGRSRTQRNKICALGLDAWTEAIVISEEIGSEKPAARNYQYFEKRYGSGAYVYVGNDLSKDFLAANRLGWQTVCVLDDGSHIRPQQFDGCRRDALPQFVIEQLR